MFRWQEVKWNMKRLFEILKRSLDSVLESFAYLYQYTVNVHRSLPRFSRELQMC